MTDTNLEILAGNSQNQNTQSQKNGSDIALKELAGIPKSSHHILIIDDDRIIRILVSEQAKTLGHTTSHAANAQDALSILQKDSTIDIILLDYEMPETNGLAALKQIKQNPLLSHIPVIMATGSNKPEQIRECLSAGAASYLTKPFKKDALNAALSGTTKNQKPAPPPKNSSHNLHAFDKALFAEALDIMQDKMPAMINEYLQSAAALILNIQAAAKTNDHETITQSAHRLKSSSAMLGITAMSALAQDIEHSAQASEETINNLQKALEIAHTRLHKEI